nr:MAG TPA: hypothetical protein [Caudoviricetes sp.]
MIVIQVLGWIALLIVSILVMALLLEFFLGGH